MAYSSSSNPAYLLVPRAAGGAGALWGYVAGTTDTLADIAATGYFSNAAALGAKAKDFILVSATTGSTTFNVGMFTSVVASSAGTVSFAGGST